jgi:hypothetical protein
MNQNINNLYQNFNFILIILYCITVCYIYISDPERAREIVIIYLKEKKIIKHFIV